MSYNTSTSRWRAVSTRDAHSNGYFVYAVLTTRIYCRPTCSARLARRANVSFYDSSELAEAAGFRACKRCKPEVAAVPPDPLIKTVAEACDFIERAAREGDRGDCKGKVTLAEVAAAVGLTSRYLHKVFKERMGCTPREYAERLSRARLDDGAVEGSNADHTNGLQLQPFDIDAVFDFDAFEAADGMALPMDFMQWDLCTDTTGANAGLDQSLWLNDWDLPASTAFLGFATPSEYSSTTGSTISRSGKANHSALA